MVKAVGSPAHSGSIHKLWLWQSLGYREERGVCLSHTGSGTGLGSIKGVSGEGKMSSTSSMMRSFAVESTFVGIGEPPS